jgi:hypothetical protein
MSRTRAFLRHQFNPVKGFEQLRRDRFIFGRLLFMAIMLPQFL